MGQMRTLRSGLVQIKERLIQDKMMSFGLLDAGKSRKMLARKMLFFKLESSGF